MSANTFGKIFSVTTFGESHGVAIGGVIQGCPAGLEIDVDFIQQELDRRKPGQSAITTHRKENDEVEFLSGIFEGKSLGSPIAFILKNNDARSADYDQLKNVFRPSHADYTYQQKYGLRDYRGGGRSSVRETAARVVAGAIAKLLLSKIGIKINAYTSQIGTIKLTTEYKILDSSKIESNPVRCPDESVAKQMIAAIEKVKLEGDSLGGVITCVVQGVPIGLGEPVFDKLHADLGKAMLSINAVKGFEIGSGFAGSAMKGSEHNDAFENRNDKIGTTQNYSGGIQGGISNGEDIYFNVAFKPTSTIAKQQQTIDVQGNPVLLEAQGRHDPCVVPRAVPIVEAMAAIVLADHYLRNKLSKL
ncbi:MAG: chorismate synthase [Bacteroidetes bacterium]|nr:chorismate synthase [Bacteroidota bacterium]